MKLLRFGQIGAEKLGLLDSNGFIRDLSSSVTDDTRLGPCVSGFGKFISIGLNYADHAAESGMDVLPRL